MESVHPSLKACHNHTAPSLVNPVVVLMRCRGNYIKISSSQKGTSSCFIALEGGTRHISSILQKDMHVSHVLEVLAILYD